ncbi:MAG: GNAT family N-acetyltransferase [Gallionellaceae bacterium]|jgi:GNAT superfamily N-acetyltransferase|nr:GNAT family N-acetyltransferase [Gallionellaceae bacterium]
METPEVRKLSFAELADDPAFDALVASYAAEAGNPELPPPTPDIQLYLAMEAAGRLHVLGAFVHGELVGFCLPMVYPLPHYAGTRICSFESIFVNPDHRAAGIGLLLRHAAEELAREQGAAGMYVVAPSGSAFARSLAGEGYRETNRAFFKKL